MYRKLYPKNKLYTKLFRACFFLVLSASLALSLSVVGSVVLLFFLRDKAKTITKTRCQTGETLALAKIADCAAAARV